MVASAFSTKNSRIVGLAQRLLRDRDWGGQEKQQRKTSGAVHPISLLWKAVASDEWRVPSKRIPREHLVLDSGSTSPSPESTGRRASPPNAPARLRQIRPSCEPAQYCQDHRQQFRYRQLPACCRPCRSAHPRRDWRCPEPTAERSAKTAQLWSQEKFLTPDHPGRGLPN